MHQAVCLFSTVHSLLAKEVPSILHTCQTWFIQVLHFPPGRKYWPMSYRHVIQEDSLLFAIDTAKKQKSPEVFPKKLLERDRKKESPNAYQLSQQLSSLIAPLCLRNLSLQSGSRNKWWEVFCPQHQKNSLGGHSLTQREWGEEREAAIPLAFND